MSGSAIALRPALARTEDKAAESEGEFQAQRELPAACAARLDGCGRIDEELLLHDTVAHASAQPRRPARGAEHLHAGVEAPIADPLDGERIRARVATIALRAGEAGVAVHEQV